MAPFGDVRTLDLPGSALGTLRYLVYPPAGPVPPDGWPLLLFLHGAGERGDDLARVEDQGLPKRLREGLAPPAAVLAPQCPEGRWWTEPALLEALGALLDDAEARGPVDPERVLATGLSMGGFGIWALALAQPRRFAALAPICGGGEPERACEIAHVPHWVFHGARDEVVPARRSEAMVRALEACGAPEVRFTLYPELEHDSWSAAYAEPELLDWLLARRRAS